VIVLIVMAVVLGLLGLAVALLRKFVLTMRVGNSVGWLGSAIAKFPRKVPHGVQFFQRMYGVSDDPEAFAALAPRCPVFEVATEGGD